MRSPRESAPASTGARWTERPGLAAALRAEWRARGDRRATLAAWAARQPVWRRALVLAVGGAVGAAAFGALFAAFPAGELDAYGRQAPTPVGAAVLRAIREVVGGGVCAGLAYAAVTSWLLDARRSRRWAAGALVGVAFAIGLILRPLAPEPAVNWAAAVTFALFSALLGVVAAVPPAWAVEQVQPSARVV